MKFSCDRCDAQYMISDEKVGPNGVKVRCKKCGNVILVRRAAENGATGAEAAAKPAAVAAPTAGAGAGAGLEDELGSAFDHAFGEPPAAAPKPDLDATQGLDPADAAKIAAAAAPAPAATEWYVAIGQAQVGPLPLTEVKKKWQGGEVGSDSLVWRPGMGDWSPLSSVPDLAGYLAPVPQPSRASVRAAPSAAAAASPAAPARDVTPTPSVAPGPEVTWKPSGASALAALASEEIAVRSAPEAKPEARRAVPSGARSMVEDLPDGGGVDPTGAIPLPMKALEHSEERKIERRSSVARGAEEIRRKRGNARMVVGVLLALAVLGGGSGVGWVYLNGKGAPAQAQPAPVAAAPVAPAPVAAAPTAAPEQPTPAAAQPAPAAAPLPAPVPALAAAEPPPPAKVEPPVAKAEPPPAKTEPPPPPAKRSAAAKAAPPAHEKPAPRAQVARAEPPPAAEPAPARKARDPLLDFDGGSKDDDALSAALGTSPSGRSVYVPGGAAKPAAASSVTDSQVTGAILTKRDALAACVAGQRKSDPEASGTIKMGWSIAPDGAAQNVRCLTPEFASTDFARCVSGVLRGVRFPASSAGRADVSFPLKF
jgi:predicted Zn finger-like uncharacterized protein